MSAYEVNEDIKKVSSVLWDELNKYKITQLFYPTLNSLILSYENEVFKFTLNGFDNYSLEAERGKEEHLQLVEQIISKVLELESFCKYSGVNTKCNKEITTIEWCKTRKEQRIRDLMYLNCWDTEAFGEAPFEFYELQFYDDSLEISRILEP